MNFNLVKLLFLWVLLYSNIAAAQTFVELVRQVKPSIVGVGTYSPTARPPATLRGTGFAILDGSYVVTNWHVIPDSLDNENLEKLVVFAGEGRKPQYIDAEVIRSDREHDLAILKLKGKKLPAMKLAPEKYIEDGTDIALTGFPIGSVLGLWPATHKGIVAAMTPMIEPKGVSQQLSAKDLKRLRNPEMVYQLDIVAYPGNSGSPLYLSDGGEVVGILNKVFVKESKETILEKPSGISYAIPVKHLHKLAKGLN